MRMFKVFDILVMPPLKLDISFVAADAADTINDFLARKVKNLR